MRTFLVNLDKSVERLKIAHERAAAAGVEFERFSAVDGRALPEEEIRRVSSPFRQWCALGYCLNRGEIGCALSHLEIYRKMAEENISLALVLEDDVLYLGDVHAELREVEKFADITRPQAFQLVNIVDGKRVLVTDRFGCEPIRSAMYTSSYALTLPAAKALLKQNLPLIVPADGWGRWVRHKVIELYQVYPAVFGQWSDGSYVLDPTQARGSLTRWGRWIRKLKRCIGVALDRMMVCVTGR